MASATSIPSDLQSVPSRNAVHLQDEHRAVGCGQQIDPRIVGTNDVGSANRELRPFRGKREGSGPTAARVVRSPYRPALGWSPLHRAEHAIANDECAHIAPAVIDRSLEIVHRVNGIERPEDTPRHLLVGDAHHPESHRTEQGFDDDVAHALERPDGVLTVLTHDGFGRGQSCVLEQCGGVELVDRTLDGAWRVHDADPAVLEPMQRVDAEDDLLEGPVGDDAREHGVRLEMERPGARFRRTPTPESRDQCLIRAHIGRGSLGAQRPAELVGVPAFAGAQNRDVH